MKNEKQILDNCMAYLVELKKHDSREDLLLFWKNIIGLSDEEIRYYMLIDEDKE